MPDFKCSISFVHHRLSKYQISFQLLTFNAAFLKKFQLTKKTASNNGSGLKIILIIV